MGHPPFVEGASLQARQLPGLTLVVAGHHGTEIFPVSSPGISSHWVYDHMRHPADILAYWEDFQVSFSAWN